MNCDKTACRRQVNYLPSKQGLNETHVVITHLSSFVRYEFRIYAKNRVSEVAQEMHGIEASFTLHRVTTKASSEFLCFSFFSFSVNGRTRKFNQSSLESNKKPTCSCYTVLSSTSNILLSTCTNCQSSQLLSLLIGKKL